MTPYERVIRAINFESPDRIPVLNMNQDELEGDVLWYDLRVYENPEDGSQKGLKSEWGYVWDNLDDGTMGQPHEPVLPDLEDIENYVFPTVNEEVRFAKLDEFMKESEGYYRVAMMIINGFTTYTFLRGFENSMIDFALREPEGLELLKGVFEFEKKLIKACKDRGFHGYHLGDDWGTQQGMMISPEMWDEIFAPLYKDLIDYAHSLDMHIWFHSCGNFEDIIERLHNLGVDVINISQPNVVNYRRVGERLKGKQCFMMALSYQTTSISGTREEIFQEAENMYQAIGTEAGGFIGYTEEYSCMGMRDSNFESCKEAFRRLK